MGPGYLISPTGQMFQVIQVGATDESTRNPLIGGLVATGGLIVPTNLVVLNGQVPSQGGGTTYANINQNGGTIYGPKASLMPLQPNTSTTKSTRGEALVHFPQPVAISSQLQPILQPVQHSVTPVQSIGGGIGDVTGTAAQQGHLVASKGNPLKKTAHSETVHDSTSTTNEPCNKESEEPQKKQFKKRSKSSPAGRMNRKGDTLVTPKSDFRGVSYHRRDRKWTARTWLHGKMVHIGMFKQEDMAALMVDIRNLQVLGEACHKNMNFNAEERITLAQQFALENPCPQAIIDFSRTSGKGCPSMDYPLAPSSSEKSAAGMRRTSSSLCPKHSVAKEAGEEAG
eukprot:CAMPEP_0203746972 /NCGR_PEP_ID=MMETSP0098-20131031/2239_1 /ASSEMBLY_ACC=CAM_ASM_000208 /TAXON_ID=96639 /ORGANISM=" , Strain NY0313808BC1" /LENGTH=340 /DNA_ID=CAMNT_0050635231 /DNA_START=125 /DNA_END=1148 /DNA_ORIENTATION=+